MLEGFIRGLSEGDLYLAGENQVLAGQYLAMELVLPTAQANKVRVLARVILPEEGAIKNAVIHRSTIQIVSIHKDDLWTLQHYILTILNP